MYKKIYTENIILCIKNHSIIKNNHRMHIVKKVMHGGSNYGIICSVCNNAESGEKFEYK